MRRKLVAGNWKMNGSLEANARLLAALLELSAKESGSMKAEMAVCIPFPYLPQVAQLLQGSQIAWGAQTLSEFDSGAYTGEVSASMLSDFQCQYVIVGHSERRQVFKESNLQIAQKLRAAITAGLSPILCVGETLEERESGETLSVVYEQLDSVLNTLDPGSCEKLVIAYEPVWAIGTGKTAKPEQAQEIHAALRSRLSEFDKALAEMTPLLYGGSVKADNAESLFGQTDIDGGLIGGASLKAQDFIDICKAVA